MDPPITLFGGGAPIIIVASVGPHVDGTPLPSSPPHCCCRAWAGKSSDISFYLNSHHIDIHNWSIQSFAEPVRVVAMSSNGVARAKLGEATGFSLCYAIIAFQDHHTTIFSGCAGRDTAWPGIESRPFIYPASHDCGDPP